MSNDRPSTSSEPAPDAIRGQRFAAALAVVLRHEGGLVHHPLDPGGATNIGTTASSGEINSGMAGSVKTVAFGTASTPWPTSQTSPPIAAVPSPSPPFAP